MRLMPQIATANPLLATVSVPLRYGRRGMLLAYGVGHCAVIVSAGTSTELVERYLKLNEQSKGLAVLKYICGVLVIDGCKEECARKTMELAGFKNFQHLRLAEMGFEKRATRVTAVRIREVVDRGAQLLVC
jgi:hypothetical protein